MSDLTPAEMRHSVRRSARNGIVFGGVFVVIGVAFALHAGDRLWEPLSQLRPVPAGLLYGVIVLCGVALVVRSAIHFAVASRALEAEDDESPH